MVAKMGGNRGNSLDGQRLTVDDGVESVDGIGGVLDDATGAIGLNQRVRAGHNISRAGFLLVLVVSGQGIRHGIAVAVLRVRVVFDGRVGKRGGDLGNSWVSSQRSVVSSQRCRVDADGAGDGHDGGEDGEL
uniref:Uncharacterized protein n=1 Tax=Anopheles dirus TaxID=7168 RepID=A0A182NWM9_9DIPT